MIFDFITGSLGRSLGRKDDRAIKQIFKDTEKERNEEDKIILEQLSPEWPEGATSQMQCEDGSYFYGYGEIK